MALSTGGTEKVRVDSAGNVILANGGGYLGLGNGLAAFPAITFPAIYGTTTGGSGIFNEAGHLVLQPRSSGALRNIIFATGNPAAERMRITSSGSVNIGSFAFNAINRLQVSGEGSTSGTNSLTCVNSAGTNQLFLRNDNFFNSGAIANYTVAGTALVIDGLNFVGKTTSSLRYKKDVLDYDKGLSAILRLRPVYYKSNAEGPNGVDPKQHAGFIAEEIAEAGFEEFLIRNEEGLPDAIQYAHMTALLCKAIQELKATVDAQAARIAALETPSAES
jgi:hypothetical protein